MNRVKRKLTAEQQARVDEARAAAEDVDRDDLIRQANVVREQHDGIEGC